jgi:hypothetical protein
VNQEGQKNDLSIHAGARVVCSKLGCSIGHVKFCFKPASKQLQAEIKNQKSSHVLILGFGQSELNHLKKWVRKKPKKAIGHF